MRTSEFEELDVSKQIAYVEEKRVNGECMADIAHSLGYCSKSHLSLHIKELGYRYNIYNKKYVELGKTPTENLAELLEHKSDLVELLEHKSDIFEMLKYYKDNTDVLQKLDIENLPQELQGNVIPKSVKVYEKVNDLFDELCSQHSNIKKQDLLSLALYEFYKRYKK